MFYKLFLNVVQYSLNFDCSLTFNFYRTFSKAVTEIVFALKFYIIKVNELLKILSIKTLH